MNDLKSHAEIEKLRESPPAATYAWDFILCEGDTLREKYTNLYEIVRTRCLRQIAKNTKAFVVCEASLCIGLVTTLVEGFTPKYEKIGDLTYVGDFSQTCGGNGYHTGFQLYEDNRLKDELLVVREPA